MLKGSKPRFEDDMLERATFRPLLVTIAVRDLLEVFREASRMLEMMEKSVL